MFGAAVALFTHLAGTAHLWAMFHCLCPSMRVAGPPLVLMLIVGIGPCCRPDGFAHAMCRELTLLCPLAAYGLLLALLSLVTLPTSPRCFPVPAFPQVWTGDIVWGISFWRACDRSGRCAANNRRVALHRLCRLS